MNGKSGPGDPAGGNGPKKPYEKPQIIAERKIEAMAITCEGNVSAKASPGQLNPYGGVCLPMFLFT